MPAAKKTETKNEEVQSTQLQKNVRFYHQFMTTPKDAQKPFDNGSFKGTDINPMWRIKVLTEVFGPSGFGWWTNNVRYEFVECPTTKETHVFCELDLYVKDPETGEVSQPIYGIGGNTYLKQWRSGPKASDEAKKMAYTDALSIACKSLGVGHDIWYSNDKTKYTMPADMGEVSAAPKAKATAKPAPASETTAEPAVEPATETHTEDTQTVINEIQARLAVIGKDMSREDKQALANNVIKPTIGMMNYMQCTDITKLIALRDKLSA